MLVDANILLYAVDESAAHHSRAKGWVEEALNGSRRVGLPWQTLTAFVRIATNPRALAEPLTPVTAWQVVEDWLEAPVAWIPQPGAGYGDIFGRLVTQLGLTANLVSDAALAALCIEHGLMIASADSDFARFPELRWWNPLVDEVAPK